MALLPYGSGRRELFLEIIAQSLNKKCTFACLLITVIKHETLAILSRLDWKKFFKWIIVNVKNLYWIGSSWRCGLSGGQICHFGRMGLVLQCQKRIGRTESNSQTHQFEGKHHKSFFSCQNDTNFFQNMLLRNETKST